MNKDLLSDAVDRGLSQRQIAREFGCSQVNVRHWLNKFELSTKRPVPKARVRRPVPLSEVSRLPDPPAESARYDPHAIGTTTEAAILAALTGAGYFCYVPFGVGRADLVIETYDGLKSVQCKTARFNDDKSAVEFSTSTTSYRGERPNYLGVVDYFGVAVPGQPDVYLVPVDEVGPRRAYLRLRPPKNGQRARIRMAKPYLVPRNY